MKTKAVFDRNYFEIFGLAQSYALDKEYLRAQYISLQAQFHPDKYVNHSPIEKQVALQLSTLINDGYQVLKDPIKRAEYLLLLNNQCEATQSAQAGMDFLSEQMELREQLEEAKSADSTCQLKNLKEIVSEKINHYEEKLVELFKQTDLPFETIKQTLCEFQFYEKLALEMKQ